MDGWAPVSARADLACLHEELIVVLAAQHAGTREAAANLHALQQKHLL